MGSPAGASTNQPGPASVYTPVGQANADQSYQAILAGLQPFAVSPGNTPAGVQYPIAQQSVYNDILYNPARQQYVAGTGNAYNLGIASGNTAQDSAAAITNAAFDPQQALYNQTLNQTQQQAAAANARSGVLGTPYGQAVADNATNNFNINWQNQQLNREVTGGQAAQQIYGAGLSNLQSGVAAPYNAYNAVGNNTLTGLTNLANLGNNQYYLPQQTAQDLQSYLQLGQAASLDSAQIGQTGLQEQQAAAAGFGNTAALGSNLLFGSNGIGGANGLIGGAGGAASGLFGGGGGAAGAGAITDAGGIIGGGADAAITDAGGTIGGGGLFSGLTSFLPAS
jgi:hypothetical protein